MTLRSLDAHEGKSVEGSKRAHHSSRPPRAVKSRNLKLVGATLLIFVWLPHATIPLGWALVGLAAIVGIFGPILQLPDWLTDLSPFTHSPVPAGDDTDWTGGIWMLALGAALSGAAIWSMRARELSPGG